jgi:hypothetical protein
MKKIIFSGLIILLTMGSYAQEKKSLLEGTWRCVSMGPLKMPGGRSPSMTNGSIKTFSKEYFTFVGHVTMDTVSSDVYGAGTYTLNGNKYEENIIYHNDKSLIGTKYKAIDEIVGDTLYHRTNDKADSWELGGKEIMTEKYVRLK